MSEEKRMEFRVGSEDIPSCPKCGSTQVRENGFVIGIDHIGNSKWKADVAEISRDLDNHAMCNEDNCEWEGVTGDLYRPPSDHQLSVKEMHTIEYTIKATSRQAAQEKMDDRDHWEKDITNQGGTWNTADEPLDLEFPEPEQLKRYFERIVLETNVVALAQDQPEWKDADAVVILRTLSELVLHGNEEINKLTKDNDEIVKAIGNVEVQLGRFIAPWAAGDSIPSVMHKMAEAILGYRRRCKKMEEEIHSTGQQATEEIDKLTKERDEMARSLERTLEMLKEEKKWQESRFATTQERRS